MIRRLQKRYALSEQGAKDLIKGCFACVLQNISLMFPVGLLDVYKRQLFPQGYSAIALHPELIQNEPSVLLMDIGGWTAVSYTHLQYACCCLYLPPGFAGQAWFCKPILIKAKE